jgi:hypothetical protein
MNDDKSNPLRFQGGVAAPLIKRTRSLAAQTGWLVISNKNKERYASIYRGLRDLLLTTPPSASNGLMPRAPLL